MTDLKSVEIERRRQGVCYDCGRRYGDEYGFPDLVVSDLVWLKISPDGGMGGLLCPSCMCRRAYLAGIELADARFASGPFSALKIFSGPFSALKRDDLP